MWDASVYSTSSNEKNIKKQGASFVLLFLTDYSKDIKKNYNYSLPTDIYIYNLPRPTT